MDIATVVGLIASLAGLAAFSGGDFEGLLEWPMLVIVFFGGATLTLIAFPLGNVVGVFGVVPRVFGGFRGWKPVDVIPRVVFLAETARRLGIIAIEAQLKKDDDPWLAKGFKLAVDGTEPTLIMDIMETELKFVGERHAQNWQLLHSLGRNWLIFGTLAGLIALMLNPTGTESGVRLVGQALPPVLYGLALAGVVAWPFRRKLMVNSQQESLRVRMIIEGVMATQAGDNPRIIEHKLSVFLAPRLRPGPEEKPEPVSKESIPVPDGSGAEEMAAYLAENQERILSLTAEVVAGRESPQAEKDRVSDLLGEVRSGGLTVVGLLAQLETGLRSEVLQILAKPPPPPLTQIDAGPTFDFESLPSLTDQQVQRLLREVDQKDLVIAMKGASKATIDKLTNQMSARVRTFIIEEMHFIKAEPALILATQARVAQQVVALRQANKL